MAYVALYRQWRPQDFDSLVGQEHISVTLKNAVSSGKIAHAYLFTGSRGTGKTSTAKILAKALNCQSGPTPRPCNICSTCRQINAGSSMDVFEIDAASNRGIDEIRDLRETIKFAPAESRYKVYIIDEVHMLTTEAFNALLKTLEEPPAHVVFILATTEPHKIPATIHSRCQRYDFRRIGAQQIEERLALVAEKTDIEITAEALRLIAVKADGSMRDALSVLDQCLAFDRRIDASLVRKLLGMIGQEVICSLVDSFLEKDACAVLVKIDDLVNHGKDVRQLLLEITLHMRALMLYKAAPSLENIEMYSENKDVLARQSSLVSHAEIVKILDVLHEAANEAKWAQEPRIQAEMALISICRRAAEPEITALVARLEALESKMASSAAGISTGEAPRPPATPVKNIPKKAEPPQPPFKMPNAEQPPGAAAEKPSFPKPAKASAKNIGENPAILTQDAAEISAAPSQYSDTELSQIWDKVLKEALSSNKRPLHACIMQGRLVKMTDSLAQVEFTVSFPKERTEKEDFRIMVENLLAQITGRQRRLVCTLAGRKPAGAIVKKEPAEKLNDLPPMRQEIQEPEPEHPALAKAKEIFGGKTEKISKN